jgi:anti-sigma-K factor RskA
MDLHDVPTGGARDRESTSEPGGFGQDAPNPEVQRHAPKAAAQLAVGWARTLVAAEASCAEYRCEPDCRVAQAVRRVVAQAAALAAELAEKAP